MHSSPPSSLKGLTTQEAFAKLIEDVSEVLQGFRGRNGRNWLRVLHSSFDTNSDETTLCWISLAILLLEILTLLLLYPVWADYLVEALLLLLLTILVSSLIIWENYKRVNELPAKIENTLTQLKDLTNGLEWDESVYPDLYMPLAPCITLQWCFRDGSLINLPWSLLVSGDLIVISPSQKVITKCELVSTHEVLTPGEIYNPKRKDSLKDVDLSLEPKLHSRLDSTFAKVLETPYKAVVQESLDLHLARPASFYTRERHIVLTRIVERVALPAGLAIFLVVCSIVTHVILPKWLEVCKKPYSPDVLLLPLVCTFPLIPILLPVIVSFLHSVGNAKLYIIFSTLKKSCSKIDLKIQLGFRHIYHEAWRFFVGREEVLHRTEKLLDVLATVTALCCVDKKGVLSWPNPTADEVFFLKTNMNPKTKKRETTQEVLDITHDNVNAFGIHFDDLDWENEMAHLKPIGLNILLNTCNYNARSTYSYFHSQIIHELHANRNDVVIPVTSRRCLCELARIMGFTEKATDVFKLEQELCCYRHIESDENSRHKLNKARIKFPFPHMMSVIVREKACQSLQLMSQGTGDMILDVCEDFWDGTDLRPLTETERKLILDFYQRTSLTSVCSTFAYKPVFNKVHNELASLYLELPPLHSKRYLPYYSLSVEDTFSNEGVSISSDCLYNLAEKRRSSEKEVNDIDGYIEVQTGQVFLGMVAMQYEACPDVVQLVEQLDQACVRFVHFSKENELRSRLFSEKMGLESGWNCHISLSSSPEEDEELSIDHASLLLRNDKKFRRATLTEALKRSSNIETTKRPRRLTSQSNDSAEDSKLLSRCSTSVPEMSSYANDLEELLRPDDVPESDEDESSMQAQASNLLLSTPAQADNNGREYSLASFGEGFENADHRTPLGIDMTNRAKLPKGIDEVRYHLEHDIDNVPLLVSLFTDCTAETTREMIEIMQKHQEVILLLGSVCSIDNPGLFLQADASVALEPMYPQACRKHETFSPSKNCKILPTDVGALLSSLSCSFVLKREDVSIIHPLIAQARHFMNNCSRNSLQFWLSCQISLTTIGFLGVCTLLPPLFVLSDVIWLSCIVIPILALTLSFATMGQVDSDVMEQASWKKNFRFDRQSFNYVLWFYGMKFFPSLLNTIFMTMFNMRSVCGGIGNGTCIWVYPYKLSDTGERMEETCDTSWYCGPNADKLLFIQQYSLFFLVLYFMLISSSFLYRFKYIWVKNPFLNKIWVLTSIAMICVQCVYCIMRLRAVPSEFHIISPVSYVWGFCWCFVLLGLNELLRRQEIKNNIRYQKRARLDFGTKLGMNSPF